MTDLARQLGASEPETRRLAAQRLPQLESPEVVDLLLKALGDADWRVRKEAATVAPRLAARVAVVAALVSSLGERDDVGLRNAAVEALVAIGADAVEATVAALGRLDADGRKLAIEVLAGVPSPRAVRAMCEALGDDDPNVRATAAEGLARAADLGESDRDAAISALTGALATAEVQVKLAVLESLHKLDARLPWRVLEPIARDPILKRHAMPMLASCAEPEAVVALARAVADPSSTVAREAVIALGDAIENAADDEALMDVVRRTLHPSEAAQTRVRTFAQRIDDPRVRGAALAALGLVRHPDDVQLLVGALGDDDVAERAELGLELYGEDAVGPMLDASRTAPPPARSASISIAPLLSHGADAEVVGALRDALDDGAPDVVAAALTSLGRAGDEGDVARIAAFVTHADARIANTASEALAFLARKFPRAARAVAEGIAPTSSRAPLACLVLGAAAQLGGPEDVSFLRTALAQGDARARRAAATALGAFGGEAAIDAVSFALMDEERDVVMAAVRALGRMSLDPAEIVVRLAPLVDHEAWEVRKVAVESVGRAGTPSALHLLKGRLAAEHEPVVRAAIAAWTDDQGGSREGEG